MRLRLDRPFAETLRAPELAAQTVAQVAMPEAARTEVEITEVARVGS
jgi:hypothetical protein